MRCCVMRCVVRSLVWYNLEAFYSLVQQDLLLTNAHQPHRQHASAVNPASFGTFLGEQGYTLGYV
jgi:hypothetical protein